MALNPAFISTPRIGIASVSNANTATDGTGTITDVIQGVSAGTRVLEIVTQSTETPNNSIVNLFINDGTNWHLFDQVGITSVVGSSTTTTRRTSSTYTNLVLPNASYKIGCTVTVQPISGSICVIAFGGDLT